MKPPITTTKPEAAAAFWSRRMLRTILQWHQLPSIPLNHFCSVPELPSTAIAAAQNNHSPVNWIHGYVCSTPSCECQNSSTGTHQLTDLHCLSPGCYVLWRFSSSTILTEPPDILKSHQLQLWTFRSVRILATMLWHQRFSNWQFTTALPAACCAGLSTFIPASVPDLSDLNSDKLPTPKAGTFWGICTRFGASATDLLPSNHLLLYYLHHPLRLLPFQCCPTIALKCLAANSTILPENKRPIKDWPFHIDCLYLLLYCIYYYYCLFYSVIVYYVIICYAFTITYSIFIIACFILLLYCITVYTTMQLSAMFWTQAYASL